MFFLDRFQSFLNDFWNFEMFTNLGPIIAKLGPADAIFMAFIIHKYFKNIRKYLGTSWEILSLEIWESKHSKMSEHVCTHFSCVCLWHFWYLLFTFYISRRWGSEHDKFSINKIHKSLDMHFISIKKTRNCNLVNSTKIFIFNQGNHLILSCRK